MECSNPRNSLKKYKVLNIRSDQENKRITMHFANKMMKYIKKKDKKIVINMLGLIKMILNMAMENLLGRQVVDI